MPLHLLGKKSWNVYNSENVARVRRDEAQAQARQEAAEQQMQEEDAAHRIALLRGEKPPPPRIASSEASSIEPRPRRDEAGSGLPHKRRRIRGEDDTDRDIRYAKEDAEAGHKARQTLLPHREDDAPLHDHAGHIQLIAAPDEKALRREKNAEAEKEKAQKRKREEDQYTMRFSNAAGFKNGTAKPWYASSGTSPSLEASSVAPSGLQEKDAWGKQDPLRREREQTRISTNDPFAAMQHAQRQLKQSAADKEKWNKKRMAEVEDLRRDEERRRRVRRREREDSLEGFELDALPERKDRDAHRRRHHHSSRRRDKERSRSRDRR